MNVHFAKKYEGLLYSTPLKSTSPFPSSQDCFDSCQTVFPISLIIEVEISAKKKYKRRLNEMRGARTLDLMNFSMCSPS